MTQESLTKSPVCETRIPDFDPLAGWMYWERDVIYFANVFSMFFGNTEQEEALQREVGGVESHGGRFIPILELLFRGAGRNLLYLQHAPDEALMRYFSSLGLALPEIRVLGHRDYKNCHQNQELLKEIKAHPAPWIDGYVTDAQLQKLAKLTGKKVVSSAASSRRGNDKIALYHFLEEQGLPTLPTRVAKSEEEVREALAWLRSEGYRFGGVRSPIGASGVGLQRLATDPEVSWILPAYFFHEGEVLVQGWLGEDSVDILRISSPSVQLFLGDYGSHHYDVTQQVLSQENHFKGNASEALRPPEGGLTLLSAETRNELLRQAGIVGDWLYELGMRGPVGVDFIVATLESGAERIYVCEANARVTGATYPSLLAHHFSPRGAWLMRNLKFLHPVPTSELLQLLESAGFLFHEGDSSGVLPYNLYRCEHGRVEMGQMLCLGPNLLACEELLLKAEAELPIDWTYERE